MSKKSKLHICFVLDETGSMSSVINQTISGFNEYIAGLRNQPETKDALFTLVKFHTGKFDFVCQDVPLDQVPLLSRNNYIPESTTPLYDAIGRTIVAQDGKVTGKKQSVLVTIQTDGLENASREYNRAAIFDMITAKKALGWQFVFLGADQDAWAASEGLGISKGNTLSYDSTQTRAVFRDAGASVASAYAGASASGGDTDNLVTTAATDKKK